MPKQMRLAVSLLAVCLLASVSALADNVKGKGVITLYARETP